MFNHRQLQIPDRAQALPDRAVPILPALPHAVLGTSLLPPYPDNCALIQFGMGCFWGAERLFWQNADLHVTAVGYAGGHTANPTYQDVCSGHTGHTEVVLVAYDPQQVPLDHLLRLFWERHDPTQGMRQGNDIGTQYRSAIYCHDDRQLAAVLASRDAFQQRLRAAGLGDITTEIRQGVPFYFAETYHQQYLEKNPGGYCGLRGTGVTCAG